MTSARTIIVALTIGTAPAVVSAQTAEAPGVPAVSPAAWQYGGFVDVHSVWHDGERTAPAFRLVEYDIPPGCVAAYFPETNALVPIDSFAEHARTPTSKDIPVRLVPRPAPESPA